MNKKYVSKTDSGLEAGDLSSASKVHGDATRGRTIPAQKAGRHPQTSQLILVHNRCTFE
jgi:hypothetical protein